jgi:hypothetical protein
MVEMMMKPTQTPRPENVWLDTAVILVVTAALGLGILQAGPPALRGVLLLLAMYTCIAIAGYYLWTSMRLSAMKFRDLMLPVGVLGFSSGGTFVLLESFSMDGARAAFGVSMLLLPLVLLFLLYEFIRLSLPPHNLRSGQWLLAMLPQPFCVILLVHLRWIPRDWEVHLLLSLPAGAFLLAVAAWCAILSGGSRRRTGVTLVLACGVMSGLCFLILQSLGHGMNHL